MNIASNGIYQYHNWYTLNWQEENFKRAGAKWRKQEDARGNTRKLRAVVFEQEGLQDSCRKSIMNDGSMCHSLTGSVSGRPRAEAEGNHP